MLASLTLSFIGSTGLAATTDQLDRWIEEKFGQTEWELVEIELPDGLPDEFAAFFERDDLLHELWLERHSMRSDDAQAQTWNGRYQDVLLPEVRTYRGAVDGDPTEVVLASLVDNGLQAHVMTDRGPDYQIVPLRDFDATQPRRMHVLFHTRGAFFGDQECATCNATGEYSQYFQKGPPGLGPNGQFGSSPNTPRLTDIGFDADYDYYLAFGSSVANVIARIDAHMNVVDYMFVRDTAVSYTITAYIVRTTQFYFSNDAYHLLDLFRAEWAQNQNHFAHDIAHLMTNKGNTGNIIGLAYVGVVCNNTYGYAWSKDSAGVVGHEIGHNYGAGHCHDYVPCNNMCGACLYIAPETRRIISAHRDSRGCLNATEPYGTPVPPYTSPDEVTVDRLKLARKGAVAVDPLVNDVDSNCDWLYISDVDRRTSRDATVRVSPGTGPQGRDELLYEPSDFFVGRDSFRYTVADGSGFESYGSVTVTITSPGTVALWKFDEGSGAEVGDSGGRDHDGTVSGSPTWTAGQFGDCLRFKNSSPAHVNFRTDHDLRFGAAEDFSVSMWVRTPGWGSQPVFLSDKDWNSGWNRGWLIGAHTDGTSWLWNIGGSNGRMDFTGGAIADDLWHHLVVTCDRDGDVEFWQDDTRIGQVQMEDVGSIDSGLLLRAAQDGTGAWVDALRGRIDEVRVYRGVFERKHLKQMNRGEWNFADAPSPPDGGGSKAANTKLEWSGGTGSTSHDVYLGTDYLKVRRAGTSSAEYLGSTAALSWDLKGQLQSGQPYYWRVDATTISSVREGPVWQFATTQHRRGRIAHWRLDEQNGTVAQCTNDIDLHGDLIKMKDIDWVSGKLRGALDFKGGGNGWVNVGNKKRMRPTDEATISAWVNIDDYYNYAGIAGYASNAGSDHAGITLHTRSGGAFGWGVAVGAEPGGMMYASSPGGYEVGRWYFVVGTFDGGALRLWVDGALVGEFAWSGPIDWDPKPVEGFEIGRWADSGTDRRLEGRVDDVALWRRALSQAEIQVLYNDGDGRPIE